MNSSEFRAEARKQLTGKWGKVALITFVYFLIFFVVDWVITKFPEGLQSLLSIALVVVELPLSVGLINVFLKVYNNEEASVLDFFTLGFNNFAKSWKVSLNILLKMIIPIVLIVISYIIMAVAFVMLGASAITGSSSSAGFGAFLSLVSFVLLIVSSIWATTKSYYYQLAYFIAIENDNLTAKECVEKSQSLMDGNRGKLFGLEISFIGWAILASFTLGIGYFWLLPYMLFATICFYKHLTNGTSSVTTEVVEDNNIDPIQ